MKLLRATRLAIAAAVVVIFSSPVQGQILSAKRGFADTGANYNDLQATGAGWYYTWGTGPANPGNFDAKFYPMFWNAPSPTTINNVKASNPNYVLGFNEPERSDQANMTVAQAISSWTQMSNSFAGTSIKLVSPAVADTGGSSGGQQWLANFMSQARAANLKVDAVAFHWYDISTPTDPAGAANQFLSRVDSYHNSYGLPVFITEFAIHDWGGTYPVSQMIDANRQFLNIVIPGLESRSYVAGYSWYNWFSDSPLYTGNPMTPTAMGYSYIGAVSSGNTADISGMNLGEHVAYLTGGTLTMTSNAGTLKYINSLANSSTISGTLDWGLNSSSNWVRIQPGATLQKAGSNQITFAAGTVTNDGVLQVAQGELRLGVGMSGIGSINISSTGDAVGSTARLELTGNISVPEPITFAQRNDPAGSDGIRNVSGNNTLGGRMTITVGGSQSRVQSDAGQLTLSGAITSDATTARNFYLQGAGNGTVSGVISDNASNTNGKINLFKAGAGTWTIVAPNTYTGTTTINGGVLRLSQLSSTTIANSAVANYSFDSVSGSTVVNSGTGSAAMNGTLANGATIVSGGRFGNAVSLANGASVNINNSIMDLGNTAPWTVSAWVKTSTPGASILTKGDGTGWSNGNTIFYLGSGTGPGSGGIPGAVRWGGGFFQGSTSAAAVDNNAWHQVTYVNSGGNYGIYVDGVAQSLSSYNSSFTAGDIGSVVRLGISTDNVASDGAVNYNGLLDSVQFYNQALSAPQVAALYSGGSAGFLPSTTDVSIGKGGTLDVNGAVQQIGSLTGSAGSAVTLGSGRLIVNSSANTQFAGTISGSGGSLVKQGTGILTLTGANTYTGSTTINGGVLRLDQLSATTIGNSAIANYSFDDIAGNTIVNSGTGGAPMSGTLAHGATIVSGGRSGNAVSLANGASVNINNPITDLGNTANWTISAWVKTTAPGASILEKGDGVGWSNGNTIFYLGSGTGPGSGGIPSGVRYAGGFFQGSTSATSVTDGTWHQVTYVNSNGTYSIYVDGVAQPLSAGNTSFTTADVGSVVRLGFTTDTFPADGTVNFSGLLDDVQVYGQALSSAQIAALYQGASTGLLPPTTDVTIASGATLDINGTVQMIASLSGPSGSAVTLGTGQLIINSATSTQFAGRISSGNGGSLIKQGTGTLTLSGANTYDGPIVVSGGTLRLNVTSGSATIASGVTATVASGATLELAGSISALGTAGSNRAHVVNNSLGASGQPAGLVVSGTNQVVGGIDGAGSTQVNAGSDLTADHIVQNALFIGGAVNSPGLVTIDASDVAGRPLAESSGFALASSLEPSEPFGAEAVNSLNLLATGGSSESGSTLGGETLGGRNLGSSAVAVPEPTTLLLALLGLAALGCLSRRKQT